MQRTLMLATAFAVCGWMTSAAADPWKDESDRGRGRYVYGAFGKGVIVEQSDRRVKIRTADGCEIERKTTWDGYEEKMRCKRW